MNAISTAATKGVVRVVRVAISPALVIAIAIALFASDVRAQQQQQQILPTPPPASAFTTTGGRPPTTWIQLGQQGDSAIGTQNSHSDAIDDAAMEPLRLNLMSEFVPHSSRVPGCGESPELSGSLSGMSSLPAQRVIGLRVFRRGGPRLNLFGMSRLGCGLDSAVGGGASLAFPITPQKTFFVLSGGAIYLPHGGPKGSDASGVQGRADIVFAREGGRSYSVGVGMVHGSPRVSVGGVF